MRFFTICPVCNKKRFLIKKRVYNHPILRTITSKNEMCRSCYKSILKMIQSEKIHNGGDKTSN